MFVGVMLAPVTNPKWYNGSEMPDLFPSQNSSAGGPAAAGFGTPGSPQVAMFLFFKWGRRKGNRQHLA